MTTVALASLFVVFVAVAVIMSSLHHSTPATAGPRVPSTSAASSSSVFGLQAATYATETATTTTRSSLDAIPGIPTPAKVAAVVTPYLSALQRYETSPGGNHRAGLSPDGCRERSHAGGSGRAIPQHHQRTGAIALGSYLYEFGENATQLQANLGRLEGDLRTATS